MVLGYDRELSETHSKSMITEAVITVPPYFGQAERKGVLDAAHIARITVLALATEHSGVALQYGIDKDFSNETRNVIRCLSPILFLLGQGQRQDNHFESVPGQHSFTMSPPVIDPKEISNTEARNLQRRENFLTYENAYAKEHGTKGGTIGLVLSRSPLAMLGWTGEKFIAWTDEMPTLKDSVALYWLTETFPRSIYPYIDFFGGGGKSTVLHEHFRLLLQETHGDTAISLSWDESDDHRKLGSNRQIDAHEGLSRNERLDLVRK